MKNHKYNTRSKGNSNEGNDIQNPADKSRKRKSKIHPEMQDFIVDDSESEYNSESDPEYDPSMEEENEETGEKSDAVQALIKAALAKAVDKVFQLSKNQGEIIDEEGDSVMEEIFEDDTMDNSYVKTLSKEKKQEFKQLMKQIRSLNKSHVPIEFKILESNIPIDIKALLFSKLENLEEGNGEKSKFTMWIDNVLKIPFGKNVEMPVDKSSSKDEIKEYLFNVSEKLESCVYGHKEAKQLMLQLFAQWISNPESYGQAIGLLGPPGTGKTTLVKDGISAALHKPFAMIALGGAQDASFLEGHQLTYIGSNYGKIAGILMKTQCMNPIIYMDELDKISESEKGEEIVNTLIHLTDSSQNNHFEDKYFVDIPFDLSKCLFIFSFNDINKINPILRDRLLVIKTDEHSSEDKLIIAKKYLIPKVLHNNAFVEDEIRFTDEAIKYLISTYSKEESGVRELKRCLEQIVMKINAVRLTFSPTNSYSRSPTRLLDIPESLVATFSIPFTVTTEKVQMLLKNKKEMDSGRLPPFGMYM